ncbi:MAG TPA: metallopeptidase family protein [Planctomycetota bacterium]|nr:metallopeptidase family protein [Planctomycetota bacterium]
MSEEVFDRLDALADEGELEAVEAEALKAIRGEKDPKDLWRYVAWARLELGRLEDALAAARSGDDPLLEGKALFHLWRFKEAEAALARVHGGAEDEAEAEWYRGVLEEFRGGDGASRFRRAARLAPRLFEEPARLTEKEIDEVVRRAKAELPAPVARAVEETAIEVLPLPRPHPDVDPLTLGLYLGKGLLERSVDDSGHLPPKIELYRRNIERIARDREEAIDELRITLLHEIGHHVGMDEDQIEDAGYG